MNFMEWPQVIIALVGILFLPGYLLTLIFFPKKNKKLDSIERFLLSFALSMAVVPLLLFFINKIGLSINRLNVILAVSSILILEGVYLTIKKWKSGMPNKNNPEINDHNS